MPETNNEPTLEQYLQSWLELLPVEQALVQAFEWALLEHLHDGMFEGRMLAVRALVNVAKKLKIDRESIQSAMRSQLDRMRTQDIEIKSIPATVKKAASKR